MPLDFGILKYSVDSPISVLGGQHHNANHTINCKRVRFVIIRHKNIRHFEANLSKQVHIKGGNTNGLTGDDARQNITVKTVWRNGQNAYSLIFALQTLNANFQNHLSEF